MLLSHSQDNVDFGQPVCFLILVNVYFGDVFFFFFFGVSSNVRIMLLNKIYQIQY